MIRRYSMTFNEEDLIVDYALHEWDLEQERKDPQFKLYMLQRVKMEFAEYIVSRIEPIVETFMLDEEAPKLISYRYEDQPKVSDVTIKMSRRG